MNSTTKIFFILLFTSAVSCTSDIELDIELPPPGLVLNASLCEDSIIVAKISQTLNGVINDSKPEDLVNNMYVNDATIELFINNVSRGIMQKGMANGQYLMPDFYPSAGDDIRMEVKAKEYEPISAEIQMLARPEILHIDTQRILTEHRDDLLQLELGFREKQKEKNYYMLTIAGNSIIEKDSIHKHPFHIYVEHTKELLLEEIYSYTDYHFPSIYYGGFYSHNKQGTSYIFSDEFIKNEDVRLDFTLKNLAPSYFSDTLSVTILCRIELSSISESYYLYCRSKTLQYKQTDAFGSIGLREPVPTYTNIINGYGLLSFKQMAAVDIEMSPTDQLPDYWFLDYRW